MQTHPEQNAVKPRGFIHARTHRAGRTPAPVDTGVPGSMLLADAGVLVQRLPVATALGLARSHGDAVRTGQVLGATSITGRTSRALHFGGMAEVAGAAQLDAGAILAVPSCDWWTVGGPTLASRGRGCCFHKECLRHGVDLPCVRSGDSRPGLLTDIHARTRYNSFRGDIGHASESLVPYVHRSIHQGLDSCCAPGLKPGR